VVLPPRGLTGQSVGRDQGEQPLLGKEGRWPLDIIPSSSAALATLPMTEETAQAPPHPVIQIREDKGTAMLEILKPAAQGPVQIRDDGRQALPVGAPGLGPDRVFQLSQALLPGPTFAPLKMIAQKVEAACLRSVDDPCLGRVQAQCGAYRPAPHPFQRLAGFRLA